MSKIGDGSAVLRLLLNPLSVIRLPGFTSDEFRRYSRTVHGYTVDGKQRDEPQKPSVPLISHLPSLITQKTATCRVEHVAVFILLLNLCSTPSMAHG